MPPRQSPEMRGKTSGKSKSGKKSKAKAAPPQRKPPTAEAGAILKLFQEADVDGNGEITESELLTVFGDRMTAEEIHSLVMASDADRDGVLDYAEFIHWLFCDEVGDEMLMGTTMSTTNLSSKLRRAAAGDTSSSDDFEMMVGTKQQMVKTKRAAIKKYPEFKAEVTAYFKDVKKKLMCEDFDAKVKRHFNAYDVDAKGGVVSYEEVAELIRVTLGSLADLMKMAAPSEAETRSFYDSFDTASYGKGQMGFDEFLTFMQALHFKVFADLLEPRVQEWKKEAVWKQLTASLDKGDEEEEEAAAEATGVDEGQQ